LRLSEFKDRRTFDGRGWSSHAETQHGREANRGGDALILLVRRRTYGIRIGVATIRLEACGKRPTPVALSTLLG